MNSKDGRQGNLGSYNPVAKDSSIIDTGNPLVNAIYGLHIAGNLTNLNWYQNIVKDGKPDRLAIDILGHLVWWYTPYESRNEQTGVLGWKKKFRGNLYQCSYKMLSAYMNASERSIRNSLVLLEELGIIKRISKPVKLPKGGLIPNALFIALIPDGVRWVSTKHVDMPAFDDSETGPDNFSAPSDPIEDDLWAAVQEIVGTSYSGSNVSAGQPMRQNMVTWNDLRIVENSQLLQKEGGAEKDKFGAESNISAGQPMRQNMVTWNDLRIVENSPEMLQECYDTFQECYEAPENEETVTSSDLRKHEEPQVSLCGKNWRGTLPNFAAYTIKNHTSTTSLATPPDSSACTRDGRLTPEVKGESEEEERAYRDFCRLFPGKVDKANAKKTWEAYEAAVAEVGADTVAAALKLNLKAYMEAPKGTVRDPYRYPLHWLEKYDGYAYWLMQLKKQRESGMPLDADGLPRVRFTLCRNGDEHAFWMTQLFSCDNRPVGGFEYLDEYEMAPLSQRQAAERYLMSHPGQTVWAVFGKDEFCKIGPDGVPSTLNAFVAL